MKEKMVEAARDLFFRYGIRSVTMDDLARHLGVSKKTLYQHFEDKAAIVTKVTEWQLKEEETFMSRVREEATDAVDEVIRISEYIRQMMQQFNPSLMYDLKKYYSDSWSTFICYKNDYMMTKIKTNIERGIEEGLYRSDISPDIIAKYRIETVPITLDNEIFPSKSYDLREVQMQCFDHFVRGMLTLKGLEIWEQYLQSLKEKRFQYITPKIPTT